MKKNFVSKPTWSTFSCASVYACTVHNTHATQVILCHHSTDNVCTTSISTLNQALAKYWLWLPDDDFCVNRNMLEQPP
jgi:succinate dehydrogenase hydrophobic anchor subunit